ncbi:hypothetical protein SAMN04488057_104176 [Cyclobacterium lianum]|uniref:Uncharacterized protein n=1 Tax=Cyclobacterium lianum TaxID=388280 RepID=A0A1M7M9J7_9BACT|nr:hypothetical protein SAMN04488057_104176 [Cyclobacterium lianum]
MEKTVEVPKTSTVIDIDLWGFPNPEGLFADVHGKNRRGSKDLNSYSYSYLSSLTPA